MERIDDLMFTGLSIIQDTARFSFGIDAIILASFGRYTGVQKALDLGTGNGAIPLFLVARNQKLRAWGLEIQKDVAEMAQRSIELNHLSDRVKVIVGDLKRVEDYFTRESFDTVLCNPPYFKISSGQTSSNDAQAKARHEIHCELKDVIRACRIMVKYGGKVFLVYPSSRIVDMLSALRHAQLEPKRLQFVQSSAMKNSHIFLVEAVKGAKPGLNLLPPLIIYENGHYTEQMQQFCFPEGQR